MKLSQHIFVWKTVYSKPKYLVSVILIALAFFALNVIIKNLSILNSFLQEKGLSQTLLLFYNLSLGFHQTLKISGFVALILIAFLVGILFTLIVFKISSKTSAKSLGFLGTLGLFLGIAAPSCTACGVGFLAVFGLGAAALAFLPLQGLEISLIALIILVITIERTTKGLLECKSCQIKLKTK